MPWPNRLEGGSYEFDGERHQLALTEPSSRSAIHGLVRWASWHASSTTPSRVVIEHVLHPQPGYPFTLRLQVEYALDDEGLTVRTSAENLGDRAARSAPAIIRTSRHRRAASTTWSLRGDPLLGATAARRHERARAP